MMAPSYGGIINYLIALMEFLIIAIIYHLSHYFKLFLAIDCNNLCNLIFIYVFWIRNTWEKNADLYILVFNRECFGRQSNKQDTRVQWLKIA